MFYKLPELTARYMRRMALDKECLAEFDTRSEFEERATPYHLANALAILKATGRQEAALELFEEAQALEWRGKRPMSWTHFLQTPAVHIRGLEHRPYWDGAARPKVAEVLEANWQDVRSDLEDFRDLHRRAIGSVPAYPALVAGQESTWDMLQLYKGRKWDEDACELAPRTAALLKPLLPSADVPYVHYNTEEVVFFLLTPGSRVQLHNGGSNAPINVGLGLRGCGGSFLEVAGEKRAMEDGRVVCFDDGTDHRVWHDGPEDRWVLTVRTMHPELAGNPAPYFSRAFTRRTCFETWGDARGSELSSRAAH